MGSLFGNGIRLFRLFGITVYLHWTWLLVAVLAIQQRRDAYSSIAWNIAEYLTLFAIVLMHEFGHALACRSVGGQADTIMLWPLGGVAFVNPPPRAGAMLWSIVAGPLVNVLLIPVTYGLVLAFGQGNSDLARYLQMIALINWWLLIFNILPIYPLDGGQILRALLWFVVGRATSLSIASIIGVIGAAAFGAYALMMGSVWLALIAAFALMQSWAGFRQAQTIRELEKSPKHDDFACPHCQNPPPAGPLWRCGNCKTQFDFFTTRGACPNCGATYDTAMCFHCGRRAPVSLWARAPVAVSSSSPQTVFEPYTPPEVQIR